MKEKKIIINQPFLPPLNEIQSDLEQLWETKQLTNGGYFHDKLENLLSNHFSIPYVSLFNNGMTALLAGCNALDLKGEVITTPYSFPATTQALLLSNLKPIFCDTKENSFNIDEEHLETLITSKTSAILPVHVYGIPCNVYKVESIAKKYNLKVIYDAAHAFGSNVNNKSIFSFGDISIVSFHATKFFNTLEGGAVFTNDRCIHEKIKKFRNFGLNENGEAEIIGLNGKMNNLQAIIGIHQLNYIQKNYNYLKKVATFYCIELKKIKQIKIPDLNNLEGWNCSYFPILMNKDSHRDMLYNFLIKNNIITKKYFSPSLHQMKLFEAENSNNYFPNSEENSSRVLCLPIHPDLNIEDVKYTTEKIIEFFNT